MTKEEAIAYGNDYYRDLTTACCEIDKKHKEFVRMSLEALEQQPCENAVSREDTLDAINEVDWETSQPKSPWIRIEFKGDALNCPLPDDGERVFLRFKNGYVTTDTCQVTIDEEDNTCYGFEDNPDFEDIDAWMKIPE